jgi:hypothetical protein
MITGPFQHSYRISLHDDQKTYFDGLEAMVALHDSKGQLFIERKVKPCRDYSRQSRNELLACVLRQLADSLENNTVRDEDLEKYKL